MGHHGKSTAQGFCALPQRPWSGVRELRTLQRSLERESLTVIVDAYDEMLTPMFDADARALRFAVPDGVGQRFVDHQHQRRVQFLWNNGIGVRGQRDRHTPLPLDARAQVAERRPAFGRTETAQILDDLPEFLLIVSQAAFERAKLRSDLARGAFGADGGGGDVQSAAGQRLKDAIVEVPADAKTFLCDGRITGTLRQPLVFNRRTDVCGDDVRQQHVVGAERAWRAIDDE